MSVHHRRFGIYEGIRSLILPFLFYGTLSFVIGFAMWPYFYYVKNENLIAIGLFATWRYGWLLLNYGRAIWYARVHFPMLRGFVDALPEEKKFPNHIYFIIMSYNEEPWVTVEAIQSLMSNLSGISSSATLIISTSGTEREHAVISSAYYSHPVRDKVDLVIQVQKHGKRIAMGHALRAMARRYYENNSDQRDGVAIFMDGDTFLPAFTLQNTLPFFATFPKLGALTTNESAYINTKSQLYKSWFNLKFGQRHILFQSHSLSHKVLTLTGRFSMFRASVCVSEDFISQIENDILTHWMHGKFRFLMGDDKSSWFNLLKNDWKMLYVPDVNVISLESRDGNFIDISSSLPYRWYGNTLRNNARTLALGPKRIGWFIWVCILEQKVTMWTALVGIVGSILLSLTDSFIYLPFYIAWVLLVRVFQITIMALTGHPVSMLTIPLMLYNQWAGAIVKIRAQYHLSDQKWSKGGVTQGADSDIITVDHPMARWFPNYMMYLAITIFAFTMLVAENVIKLPDLRLYASEPANPHYSALMYGVVADDGKDDAYAITKMLKWLPDGGVIELPTGQLDFFEPLLIERSHIAIEGVEGTVIVSHIQGADRAVIDLQGKTSRRKVRLAAGVSKEQSEIKLAADHPVFHKGDLLRLRAPNNDEFFDESDSQKWRKEQPWIRQMIVKVTGEKGDSLGLEHAVGLALPIATTELKRIFPVSDVKLSHFTMRQEIPGHHIKEVAMRFENVFPTYAVDAIRLNYVEGAELSDIVIKNSGRHPLNLNNSYGCRITGMDIDGAWNKGKGGNGYVRFARSYYNEFRDSRIVNIRHITLQWSAAFNQLSDLKTEVDINFHGGNEHHNHVNGVNFNRRFNYKWNAVTHIGHHAHWAPPEGVGNVVENLSVTGVRDDQ